MMHCELRLVLMDFHLLAAELTPVLMPAVHPLRYRLCSLSYQESLAYPHPSLPHCWLALTSALMPLGQK